MAEIKKEEKATTQEKATDKTAKPASKEEKGKVMVAVNYGILIIIIVAITLVLIKSPSDTEAITGSAAVDPWCQTHTSVEDCENECNNPDSSNFEKYQKCLDECVRKLDECRY